MKKFDKEYSTQWMREVEWLREHGIPYNFVKVDENKVTSFKYTKTKELFKALFDLYSQI